MSTPIILLLKSLVAGYHRKDGTYVKPHNRKGGPAAKPGAGQLSLFTAPAAPAKPNPFKGKDPVKDTLPLFGDNEPVHTAPVKDMIKEHERLVDVLESPSHADDKAEAKKQRKELEEYRTEAEQPKSRVLLTKPAKAGVLPDNPPYKDGILLLHGTKVEFMSGGKKRVGWVSNKYTEQQRKEGADITIRYGALNPSKPSAGRATVKEADITRIVEESPWGSDYKRS